jgi:hypothetical protein
MLQRWIYWVVKTVDDPVIAQLNLTKNTKVRLNIRHTYILQDYLITTSSFWKHTYIYPHLIHIIYILYTSIVIGSDSVR